MVARLPRHEQTLMDELKRRLPDTEARITPYRDGRRPWTLDPVRGLGPRPRGWAAATFYSLAGRGLIVIEQGPMMSVRIGLPGESVALTAVQVKVLQRLRDRAVSGRTTLQPGAHRMRYMPGDVTGSKEETYRELEKAGYISIEYSSRGSTGAWTVTLIDPTPEEAAG